MRIPMAALVGGVVSGLLLLPACSKDAGPPAASGSTAPAAAGLPDRDPALAHKLVGEGAVLLDVRTPEEYATKHLDGAVNVPVDEIDARMGEVDKLAGDKKKAIVVYCQAGGRAARAKEALLKAGHQQVTNLGGIDDWNKK